MTPQDNMSSAHFTVILEDLHAKMDSVIEYMGGAEQRLTQRMDEKFAHQEVRFDAIEAVLEKHSAMLQDHGQRLGRIEHKLVEHDSRFDVIEGKFDRLADKVDRHDRLLHG